MTCSHVSPMRFVNTSYARYILPVSLGSHSLNFVRPSSSTSGRGPYLVQYRSQLVMSLSPGQDCGQAGTVCVILILIEGPGKEGFDNFRRRKPSVEPGYDLLCACCSFFSINGFPKVQGLKQPLSEEVAGRRSRKSSGDAWERRPVSTSISTGTTQNRSQGF